MYKEPKFEQLSSNNEEEYLRHFGFSMEDLSFLISPNGSMSPSKKKPRNSSFNFDAHDGSAPQMEETKAGSWNDSSASGSWSEKLNRNLLASGQGGITPTAAVPGIPGAESIDLAFDGLENDPFIKNENLFPKQRVGVGMLSSLSVSRDDMPISMSKEHSLEFARLNSGDIAAFLNAEDQQPIVVDNTTARSLLLSDTTKVCGEGNGSNGEQVSKLPSLAALGISNAKYGRTNVKAANALKKQKDFQPAIDESSGQEYDEDGHLVARNMEVMMQFNLLQSSANKMTDLSSGKLSIDVANSGLLSGASTNGGTTTVSSYNSTTISPAITPDASRSSFGMDRLQQSHQYMGSAQNMFANNLHSAGSLHANAGAAMEIGEEGRTDVSSSSMRRIKGQASGGRMIATAKVDGDAGADSTRASKSLAKISRRFVEMYGGDPTIDFISGVSTPNDVPGEALIYCRFMYLIIFLVGITSECQPITNRVDAAAVNLGVHVRRIYELIKILEILSLVTFSADQRGKFTWIGCKDFLMTLGGIQAEAIRRSPEIATQHGLRLSRDSNTPSVGTPETMSPAGTPRNALQSEGMHGSLLQQSFSKLAVDRNHQFNYGVGIAEQQNSGSGNTFERPPQISQSISNAPFAYVPATGGHGFNIGSGSNSSGIIMMNTDYDNTKNNSLDTSGQQLTGKGSKKRVAVKKGSKTKPITAESGNPSPDDPQQFMVEGICRSFLSLFLLGLDDLTMNFAIQRLVPMQDPTQTLNEYNKLNATKIRRVYDVANVLCSLNLVKKITNHKPPTPRARSHLTAGSELNSPLKDVNRNGELGTRVASKSEAKADAKVLQWGTFSPNVIREFYLANKMDA